MPKAKAYSYIRFSTPDQIKGDSLRRQTEQSKKYAEDHELELDERFSLRDLGISAYDKSNIKKGALGHFLHLVEDGQIERGSYLLVESLDRLSRAQIMDALGVFLGILNAGITIVTLVDDVVYSRETTNNNLMNLIASIVIMSRATEESATKSKRIRAAWDNKRANIHIKRLTARCPYWMKPISGKLGFELIPDRVNVIKRIFKMAKDGIGNSTIVKRLNEESISPFSDKTNGWQPSYIQKLLRNKAVYGEFQMNLKRSGEITLAGQPIIGYYPAIMSKDEWLLVNAIRSNRRTRGGISKGKHLSNMFSGLLQCGYCGGSMVMGGYVSKKANGEKRSKKYVACSNARRGLGCYFIQWSYSDLEQQIIQFCRSVDFAEVLGKKNTDSKEIEETRKRLINIDCEITAKKEKLGNLMAAIERGESRTPEVVIRRIAEIDGEVDELIKEREQVEYALARLISAVAEQSTQQEALVKLLEHLQTLSGSKLHDLRIKLSERIKRAIMIIVLYPGGSLLADLHRKKIEAALSDPSYAAELKFTLDSLNTTPDKSRRFITIIFQNRESLSISKTDVIHNVTKRMPIKEYLDGQIMEL
jgi:DNA invertase Pin-like site-specific DNA recombinase